MHHTLKRIATAVLIALARAIAEEILAKQFRRPKPPSERSKP